MKSLRVHFYSRHGIDLDNPMPHSPSMQTSSNGRASASPGPNHGEYSELAHALGFEDRDKSTDSSLIPSHFLVPQIEISSNSTSYPTHFSFTADSSYSYGQDERKLGEKISCIIKSVSQLRSADGTLYMFFAGIRTATPSQNVSPQSDSGSNHPTSSDVVSVVVKKEIVDDLHRSPEQSTLTTTRYNTKDSIDTNDDADDIQDMPEDLSPGSGGSYRYARH
jgi:hypothetical protein